jgi:hypothetical protein
MIRTVRPMVSLIFIFFSMNAMAKSHSRSCFNFLNQIYYDVPSYFNGRKIIINPLKANIPTVVLTEDTEVLEAIKNKAQKVQNHLLEEDSREDVITSFKIANVKTVIYPSSGYDASTPFVLFPNATEVVGIDNHPFWGSKNVIVDADFYSSTNDQKLGWTVIREVDSVEYIAGIVLARLKNIAPDLRILSFYEIKDSTMSKDYGDIFLSHGVIEFDTGPNTQVRRYIHLHSPALDGYEMRPSSWWLQPILTHGFEGLIRKAGMAFLNFDVGLNLVRNLKAEGGILVDGDEVESSFVKFQFEKILESNNFQKIPVADFGYGKFTRAYRFPLAGFYK